MPRRRRLVDEAAFVDDLAEVLKAALAFRVWGGRVHVLSTHNGESSPFNRLVGDLRGGGRPGSLHSVPFAAAVGDGLARRRLEVAGQAWSPEAEAAWVAEVRAEYGADAAEELDCIPAAGDGAWLTWEQIRGAEHPDAGDPAKRRGGRCVVGNDIARRKHLWVAWVLEIAGGVAWTREISELQDASFAEQDAELDRLVERYRPARVAIDQTGMGEKPVEDAVRRYGKERVEGVLMTPAARLELAGALRRRFEDSTIRIPGRAAVRQDLHAVRRAAGPTGAPRLVAAADTDGHADRFWACALACGAAETSPAVYALHRVDNHAPGRDAPGLGRRGAIRWRGAAGALG